jgi:hypothetical protein
VIAAFFVLGLLLLPSASRPPSKEAAQAVDTTSTISGTPAPSTTASTVTRAVAPTGAPSPALVTVLVANGTSVSGGAGAIDRFLQSAGYQTLPPANATTGVEATRVYATSGGSQAATEVAAALGLPAGSIQPAGASPPVSSWGGATVVVVAGPDLAGHSLPLG